MENAFATMMNKLIVAREPLLGELLTNLRSQGNKESYYRIDKINEAFDEMLDRREELSTILVKGYIDLAMYTQEMNKLNTGVVAGSGIFLFLEQLREYLVVWEGT